MGMRSTLLATLVLLVALQGLVPGTGFAQNWVIQGTDRYFRVESTTANGPRGPVVSGYVYNTYGTTADRVRLLVESLDGSGQVTGSTIVSLLGSIGPGDRLYFEGTAPPPAASYRVRVASFDVIGRGGA